MRIKYFLIYAVAGAAFLAVSLWVLLSRGNNPKAINAKYKLGGIMLIAWSIIATASCEKGPLSNVRGAIDGRVTCYDPAPADYITFSTDKFDKDGKYYLTPGGNLTITIEGANHKEYSFTINKRIAEKKEGDEAVGELLQAGSFVLEGDSYSHQHIIQYSPTDNEYTGQVILRVWGKTKENLADDLLLWQWNLFITNGDED